MARSFRMRVLVVVAVLALLAFATPPARAQDPTFQGPPTVAPFDSDGDGRADTARVAQVVHVPQGNTTATVAGYLFPPFADPNASWSGWVDTLSMTQNITCASGAGCNQTFNLDLRAGPNAAGTYLVVLNVTRTPTLVHAIVRGSAAGGTFPGSIAVDDGGFLDYREALDSAIAEIAYRSTSGSNGVNAPKTRIWDDSSWTAATEQPTAGSSIRAIRMAWSPTAGNEQTFVIQGNDGWLDAYVCTATCTVTNNIGRVWSTTVPTTPERRFDLAYESLSGEAVLVYGVLSTDFTRDLAYRTYSGGAWSVERYLDDAIHTTDIQYTLVKLAAQLGTDQIGLVAGDDTNNDVNAWIWNGTAFGSVAEITANSRSPNEQQADLEWESASGDLVVVAALAGSMNIASREFTTGWSPMATFQCINTASGLWLSLKSNPVPTENTMVLSVGDSGSDLSTCYWNGAAWANWTVQDTSLDFTTARSFDFAWHASGNAGLLAYGTSGGRITFRTFTAPNTWSSASWVPMGANAHRWVQLRTNLFPGAGGAMVLGAVLEDGANDLGAIAWDGTGLAAGAADGLTGDTGSATYESFDLAPARVGAHRLLARYDWTNVSSAPSHTLIIKGYRGDEDGAVQVLSPPATWTTRLTISATADTLYTYTLAGTEYNGGSPSVRLVDQGGFDSTPSDLWIDWAALRLDGTPVGGAMFSAVTFDGSSSGNPFGFEFGLNLITLVVILIPVAALLAAVLLLRSRRRGPQPAYAGDTEIFEEEPDREDDDDEAEEEADDEEEEVDEDEEGDEEATDTDDGDPWRDDEGGAEDEGPDPGDPDSGEPEYEESSVQSNRGSDRQRTKLYP